MQEEKKTEKSGETKSEKAPHRHGYFIQPPTAGTEHGTRSAVAAQQPNDEHSVGHAPKNRTGSGSKKQHYKKNNAKRNTASNSAEVQNTDRQPEAVQQNQSVRNGERNVPKKKKSNHGNKAATPHENTLGQSSENRNAVRKATAASKNAGRVIFKEARPAFEHSAEDYEEYKFTFKEESEAASNASGGQKQTDSEPKTEVVGIRFKSSGKIYYFAPNGNIYKRGDGAIVDTARGQEYGEISMPNSFVRTSDIVPPLRPVLRKATAADIAHHKENKQKEDEAFKICIEKIKEHKLEMKLIDAQYTFDNSKLLFYFTSTNRVDFRELVKDLASVFRTRIELRQIGIRDEAKIMGGLGMCGRPLCCTLFLSDFDQVSIKMAKEQNLSLNSSKISGICGRLMCCLKYEHEAYEYEIKRTPPVESLVRTEDGDGIVTEINPLRGTVKVKLLSSPDVPPKSYHRDDVVMLRKKAKNEQSQA